MNKTNTKSIRVTGSNALTVANAWAVGEGCVVSSDDGRDNLEIGEAREIDEEGGTLTARLSLVMGDVDSDDDGAATVTAEVGGVETSWSMVRHADGQPGWTPAGDSLDCWVDSTIAQMVGPEIAGIIGGEIIARVRS